MILIILHIIVYYSLILLESVEYLLNVLIPFSVSCTDEPNARNNIQKNCEFCQNVENERYSAVLQNVTSIKNTLLNASIVQECPFMVILSHFFGKTDKIQALGLSFSEIKHRNSECLAKFLSLNGKEHLQSSGS